MFVIIIINSLNVIQQSIIRKELLFKKRAILTFSSSVVSGIIGIICAYRGFGVWSLVIQQISNKVILCILLYVTSPWHLRFQFSKSSAKTMFSFGSWLLLSNLIGAIFNQVYKFFVGKQYQSTELGLYVRANQFESMIGDTFSWVFGQVAFPVFSKIQDDVNLIKSHMDNFIRYSTFIVFPLLAILFVVAKPMVLLLLTEKWIGCVLFIKYFCLVGMMQPFYVFLSPLLQGLGRSKLDMVFTIIVCIGRIINILVAVKLGLGSLIIGEFFVLLFSVLITSLLSVRSIRYNYLSCFVMAKWNLIGTVISAIIGLIVCNYLEVEILQLILSIVAMSVTYIGILLLCDKQVLLGAKKIMLKNGER